MHPSAMEKAKLRRILVAVDFSESGLNALEVAKSYATLTGAPLTLVHVLYLTDNLFGAGTFAFPDTVTQITNATKNELEKLVANVMADGLGCEGVLMNGIPSEKIHEFARDPQNEIDLIIVGTHGRTGISRVAFGSVAQRILQNSPCPVLVIPTPKA